jgi:hypothetical protein
LAGSPIIVKIVNEKEDGGGRILKGAHTKAKEHPQKPIFFEAAKVFKPAESE